MKGEQIEWNISPRKIKNKERLAKLPDTFSEEFFREYGQEPTSEERQAYDDFLKDRSFFKNEPK